MTVVTAGPRQHRLLGIGLMLVAVIFLPTKDGIVKMFAGHYPPVLVLWAQFVVMYAVLAPVVLAREGKAALMPRPLGLQAVRGGAIALAVILFYWAIELIPLADATAMTFSGPLVAAALSALVLKEHVGWRRWSAVAAGLAGVLIILRPEFSGARLGYLVALGTGVCLGVFYVANRHLRSDASAVASAAHSAVVGIVLLSPLAAFLWVPPRPGDALLWGLFFIFATIGQSLVISAFRYAPASLVSIFQYFAILSATAFGYFAFGDFPDRITWLGVGILVVSGVYLALREGRIRGEV